MPLSDDGLQAIRTNLEQVQRGEKPRVVTIGSLTDVQLATINAHRATQQMRPIVAEVVFIGKHIFQSRIRENGYTIDDVLEQIASAMGSSAVVLPPSNWTTMQNPQARTDRYGKQIRDLATFECSGKFPKPELYSVAPKGDGIPKGGKLNVPEAKEATPVGVAPLYKK